MMRNERCPLCGSKTECVLKLRFGTKMKLPTAPKIRYCAPDNFLFVADGNQSDYDEYYQSLANDCVHAEMSGGDLRSPISKVQLKRLASALGGLFEQPRKVLDFGCGEASLLVELAREFPSSTFFGFDPGPAARIGAEKAIALGLGNLSISDLKACMERGPYDLVIASHVVEHLLDFDLLHLLNDLLDHNGILYVEVPDSLRYESHIRLEFLYYFDRVHVNHFTPQSLARLAAAYGFGYADHFEYVFPYRDGNGYPALGMLFRKVERAVRISSPSILDATKRYIACEKQRAKAVAGQFDTFDGILVWGAGDNFFRSVENGGPLSGARDMVVLDRRPLEISIGDRKYKTVDPQEGIRRLSWPVVVTVSEARKSISDQIIQIDPGRRVFFV